jgi:hypothetical protein
MCRGNLRATVNELASQLTRWTRLSDLRLSRLFGYVRATKQLKLHSCVKVANSKSWYLHGYADANLADADTSTRSVSGAILFITDGKSTKVPLAWSSGRQTATACSTAEAELVALARFAQQMLLPAELTYDQMLARPIQSITSEDNTACLQSVKNGFSTTLRYLPKTQRISIGFASELYEQAHRQLIHVVSADQRADIFTKALAGEKLRHALQQIGLADSWEKLDKETFLKAV